MSKPPAVDAYILKSADFARPVLRRLRAAMHKACPQIEETMKWSAPFFEHKGIVAYMAAFKTHARFGFWKWKLLKDRAGLLSPGGDFGLRGSRLRSTADLPPDAIMIRCIKAAVALNERGVKVPRTARKKRPPARPPGDLVAALRKNPKAQATFKSFTTSQQREYVEWITEAKQDATRRKRLATAIEWIAEGKRRNWKYLNC
jgi:uncharacterized protein YdeI (YjbR/CyaY-like superfamily)